MKKKCFSRSYHKGNVHNYVNNKIRDNKKRILNARKVWKIPTWDKFNFEDNSYPLWFIYYLSSCRRIVYWSILRG